MRYLLFFVLFVMTTTAVAAVTFHLVRRSSNTPSLTESIPSPLPITDTTYAQSAKPAVLLFAGDIMLDRHVRQHAEQNGYAAILSELAPILTAPDAVVANLEGPVTDFASKSVGSEVGSPRNFLFTFAPEVTDFLKQYNLTILNLGNNHIHNFGSDGLTQTYERLDTAGLQHFGYTGDASRSSYLITPISDIRFGFVNYNQFLIDGYERALTDIAAVRPNVDVLVVHPHWGLEYQTVANAVIQEQAHAFIDAGADLVIGAHPHVVQQKEEYQGKTIYYSLGNFVFDQYFSDEVREGLLVEAHFDPTTFEPSFVEYRTWLETDGRTVLKPLSE